VSGFRLPFWGKSDPAPEGEHTHLVAHALAVGAACSALSRSAGFGRALSAAARHALPSLRPLLVWLAMLHDIGKLAPSFQRQCPWIHPDESHAGELPNPAHAREGFLRLVEPRHGMVDQCAQAAGWSAAQVAVVKRLWAAACAHHGFFPDPAEPEESGEDSLPSSNEVEAARDFTLLLRALVERSEGVIVVPQAPTAALDTLFAGVVTLANWLGSDRSVYPFIPISEFENTYFGDNPSAALDGLFVIYRAKAAAQVSALRLDAQANPETPDGLLRAIFPSLQPVRNIYLETASTLRPMQSAALSTFERQQGAKLFIVEDVMGSGKTQVAQLLAFNLIARNLAQGVAVALPDAAVAAEFRDRINAFSQALFKVDASTLGKAPAVLRRPLNCAAPTGNEAEESFAAWLASDSLRGLLAPVALCNLRQLLTARETRHGFVALACVARHVVILDELHAQDAHGDPRPLLDLLTFLGQCRTPVIIQTVALPAPLRQRLLAAYQEGLAEGTGQTPTTAPQHNAYPCLLAAEVGTVTVALAANALPKRKIQCELVDEQVALRRLLDAAAQGTAMLVCNTTAAAQRRATALSAAAQAQALDVVLLHEDYRRIDRARIAAHLDTICGRTSTTSFRRGKLIVGTRALEHTLDLDVDYVASEPAPLDVLMQRAGKLWRHERTERSGSVLGGRFDIIAEEKSIARALEVFPCIELLRRSLAWVGVSRNLDSPQDVAAGISAAYRELTTAPKAARSTQTLSLLMVDGNEQGRMLEPFSRTALSTTPINEDGNFNPSFVLLAQALLLDVDAHHPAHRELFALVACSAWQQAIAARLLNPPLAIIPVQMSGGSARLSSRWHYNPSLGLYEVRDA
jgi:CRISPR-associated endonuclease/helicase Cas3